MKLNPVIRVYEYDETHFVSIDESPAAPRGLREQFNTYNQAMKRASQLAAKYRLQIKVS